MRQGAAMRAFLLAVLLFTSLPSHASGVNVILGLVYVDCAFVQVLPLMPPRSARHPAKTQMIRTALYVWSKIPANSPEESLQQARDVFKTADLSMREVKVSDQECADLPDPDITKKKVKGIRI